jgi:hypothetical protein
MIADAVAVNRAPYVEEYWCVDYIKKSEAELLLITVPLIGSSRLVFR